MSTLLFTTQCWEQFMYVTHSGIVNMYIVMLQGDFLVVDGGICSVQSGVHCRQDQKGDHSPVTILSFNLHVL